MRTISGEQDTLHWILSDHLGSLNVTANEDGTWNSEIRYTAFGEVRWKDGLTPTDYRFTSQLEQAELGLYFYVARFYDPEIAHFVQADTVVPEPGKAAAWDRYGYTLNNPIRYNDPSGHDVGCSAADPKCKKQNTYTPQVTKTSTTPPIISIDSKEIANKVMPNLNTKALRKIATKLDYLALGIDSFAEVIVLGHVAVGATGGLTFEGNPVTGGIGAGAGWIFGQTNPIVQSVMVGGNVTATLASAANILADAKLGDTRLQIQIIEKQNNKLIKGEWSINSNTVLSIFTTVTGWQTKVVEGSMVIQSIAIAGDRGMIPTYSRSGPIDFQLPFNSWSK